MTGGCCAPKRRGGLCERTPVPRCPIPLCVRHIAQVHEFAKESLQAAARAQRGEHYTHRENADRRTAGTVYYVGVGDLLKIGHTWRPATRMRYYPPGSLLLAAEVGGTDRERARLAQFRRHRADKREWFRPHPDLTALVWSLRPTAPDVVTSLLASDQQVSQWIDQHR